MVKVLMYGQSFKVKNDFLAKIPFSRTLAPCTAQGRADKYFHLSFVISNFFQPFPAPRGRGKLELR